MIKVYKNGLELANSNVTLNEVFVISISPQSILKNLKRDYFHQEFKGGLINFYVISRED